MQRSDMVYLGEKHFTVMLLAALALHVAVIAAWVLAPREKVVEIPVRVLNLKLGDIEDAPDMPGDEAGESSASDQALSPPMRAEAVPIRPSSRVWKMLKKLQAQPKPLVPHPPEATKMGESAPKPMPETSLEAALSQAARQFVRRQPGVAPKGEAGSPLGNSTSANAETATRYEQLISAWMDKFKYLPPEADTIALPVSGQLRIQIDRRGNLRSSSIERSTGHVALDRAMLDMSRRANPFPAAPAGYAPNAQMLAFVTTVTFREQK